MGVRGKNEKIDVIDKFYLFVRCFFVIDNYNFISTLTEI